MERMIQKYQFDTGEIIGKSLLHFGEDARGVLCAWILETRPGDSETTRFRVFATGESVDTTQWVHLQTVVQRSGYVWHLFEHV